MAAPASADPNRFRRPLASSAARGGEVVGNVQDVRERLKKVEQLQAAGKTSEAVTELLSIAEAYATRGAPVKAVAVLRQAAKIRPEAADIRVALGDVQQQLRMVEDAAREYGAAFEIYERSRQFGDMMQVLGRLLEMDPDNLAGQLQLAEHLARAGHNHEAADLMRTLAATLLRKGAVEDWEKVAERAHGLEATDATLAHDLALHYVRSGRPTLALGKLLRCYESVPNDAELLELIIEALEQLGQREKAAVICRQLIRTFERNGLKDEANRALERLYWLAPDDERARAYIGVMAPSVQGGTVIELQAGNSGTLPAAPAEAASARVAVARSRPGTMALPEADMERLHAAIARQAEEKAAALLTDAPPLPDDEPPPVPTTPLVRETTPDFPAAHKPTPAVVHAPTATQVAPIRPQVVAPQAPVAAKPIATVQPQPQPRPAVQSQQLPVQPAQVPQSVSAPMAMRAVDMTPRPTDLSPVRQVSQSMRVTHQQALEALSELGDLDENEDDWDDEAGFDTAERTLVEEINVETLEKHGLRLGDRAAPDFVMPVTARSQPASAAEPETAFNPVAPAQARSQILPRPRLSRQPGTEPAAAPRDMSRDLGTLDFFIERGFHDSAVALLDALDQRHPGAPELASYRTRVSHMRRDS